MSKLTKTEIYAIRWLSFEGLSSNKIAEELKLPENDVIKAIEKHSRTKKDDTEEKVRTTKSSAGRSQNLMIRETSGKKLNSVSIMTGEASMMNDELMKNAKAHNPNTEKNIFRPNNVKKNNKNGKK